MATGGDGVALGDDFIFAPPEQHNTIEYRGRRTAASCPSPSRVAECEFLPQKRASCLLLRRSHKTQSRARPRRSAREQRLDVGQAAPAHRAVSFASPFPTLSRVGLRVGVPGAITPTETMAAPPCNGSANLLSLGRDTET